MGMYENIESLDKEIARITTKLSKLEPESDAYKAVRVSLDTLYKVRNDVYKVDTEDIAARDKSEVDVNQKDKELEMRQKELDSANAKIENDRKSVAHPLGSSRPESELTCKLRLGGRLRSVRTDADNLGVRRTCPVWKHDLHIVPLVHASPPEPVLQNTQLASLDFRDKAVHPGDVDTVVTVVFRRATDNLGADDAALGNDEIMVPASKARHSPRTDVLLRRTPYHAAIDVAV